MLILLTDFSDTAREAYPVAARLADRLASDLTLFHAVVPNEPVPLTAPIGASVQAPPIDTERQLREAMERARDEALRLKIQGAVFVCVDLAQSVAEAASLRASEEGAEFIVMASHGRSGVSRLLNGSVADSILKVTRTPLLVVPPDSQAGSGPPPAPTEA